VLDDFDPTQFCFTTFNKSSNTISIVAVSLTFDFTFRWEKRKGEERERGGEGSEREVAGFLLPLFYCRILATFPMKNGVIFPKIGHIIPKLTGVIVCKNPDVVTISRNVFLYYAITFFFVVTKKKNQLTVFVLPLSALFLSGNIHVYVKKER
jgi:hypothetical protein